MKINEYVSSTFFHHFIEAGPIVEHLIHENSIFKQPIFDYFFLHILYLHVPNAWKLIFSCIQSTKTLFLCHRDTT
jgi:hypothetical protein